MKTQTTPHPVDTVARSFDEIEGDLRHDQESIGDQISVLVASFLDNPGEREAVSLAAAKLDARLSLIEVALPVNSNRRAVAVQDARETELGRIDAEIQRLDTRAGELFGPYLAFCRTEEAKLAHKGFGPQRFAREIDAIRSRAEKPPREFFQLRSEIETLEADRERISGRLNGQEQRNGR